MTSERMRDNPLFMRNEFATVGRWDIPLIHKQSLDTSNIKLVACSDTRANDRPENTQKGVHFFVDEVEQNSIVAIGMVSCKQNKLHFLRGYNAMLEKLSPSKIICFGTPFTEMEGHIITVDYMESRKVVR